MKEKKQDRQFIVIMTILSALYCSRYFRNIMTEYNTTLFALSYEFGFISRGFLGSLWILLDKILPLNLMNYTAIYAFNMLVTVLFQGIVIGFMWLGLKKCPAEKKKTMYYLLSALAIFVYPMFWSSEMFGRLDVYLYFLTLIGIILLIIKKYEWLIVPIGIIAMCIHQGFVFTNANLLLVPLIFLIVTSQGKQRKKYSIIFLLFLGSISGLFLYFEFFSHGNGEAIYEIVVERAKALSQSKTGYSKSIIQHEILGLSVYEEEQVFRSLNRREFPAFLALWFPYFLIAIHFFKGLLMKAKEKGNGLWFSMICFLLGALTMVPQYILKVDYGRYAFTVISYYIITLILLALLEQELIFLQIDETKEKIKEVVPIPQIVLLYPMFLMPFYDVIISGASSKLRGLVEFLIGIV